MSDALPSGAPTRPEIICLCGSNFDARTILLIEDAAAEWETRATVLAQSLAKNRALARDDVQRERSRVTEYSENAARLRALASAARPADV